MSGAESTSAAVSTVTFLLNEAVKFGERIRSGEQIPQDLDGLCRHRDWLCDNINRFSLLLQKKGVQHYALSWTQQLSEAQSELDKILPENRRGMWDRHVRRDRGHLKQALKIITAVQEEVRDTMATLNLLADSFKVFHWKPHLPRNPYVHCDEKNVDGEMVREGKLKHLVLSSADSGRVSTYCAHGPGGMGKTVALKWLCTDTGVEEHFEDGVHWFSFGEDLEEKNLLDQIRICALNCGSKQLEEEMRNEANMSVRVAIRKLCRLFESRKILFVIDDVWNKNKDELSWFQAGLSCGTNCTVVISSRDEMISGGCDEAVSFMYLPTRGKVSREVFLSYLGNDKKDDVLEWEKESEVCRGGLQKVLEECGGWVLCLSIAGAMLREEVRDCFDVDDASEVIDEWVRNLADEGDLTGKRIGNYDRSLQCIVFRSLNHVKQRLKKDFFQESLWSSVEDKFKRLCIMQKQKPMPIGMLQRLWALDKKHTNRLVNCMKEMCLVEVIREKRAGKFIRAHDKIIDLCRENVDKKEKGIAKYHEEVLESFLGQSTEMNRFGDNWYRPWWELGHEEEYMMENLGHHLVEAKREKELWGLLCDARFMMRWLEDKRGWIGVAVNFRRVTEAGIEVEEEVKALQRALQSCWPRISKHRYSLGFHMFGRLEKKEGGSICAFLESIEEFERGAWLQPVQPYLAPQDDREEARWDVSEYGVPTWISNDFSTVALWDDRADTLTFYDPEQQEAENGPHEVPSYPRLSYDGKFAICVANEENSTTKVHVYQPGKEVNKIDLNGTQSQARFQAASAWAIHCAETFVLGFEDGSLEVTFVRGVQWRWHAGGFWFE
ncbi:P-loop containing nucleoside triphosphate hydrolase [Gracilaria domingensis]|nr:P-loop containing nucleoside triphosphate hydrolase [Gracilaria domingensis]